MFKQPYINLKLVSLFSIFIFVSILASLFISVKTNAALDRKIADIKEDQRPADISIEVIKDSSCQECFDLANALVGIKKYNVNVVSEDFFEYDSEKGQEFIDKYNIRNIPSLIIKGELDKESDFNNVISSIGSIDNGVFVSRKLSPPYIDVNTGDIIGKIKLTMLSDSSCENCYDVNNHKKILTSLGAYITDEALFDLQKGQGIDLLNKYNIELLPTIVLSGDVSAYTALESVWPSVGTIEDDGVYVFRQGVKSMGVYKDMTTNQIIDPRSQTNNQ